MDVLKLLPGYNCGRCGRPSCRAFAAHLREGRSVDECPLMDQERYAANRAELQDVIARGEAESFPGLVGGLSGDVLLAPLPGEPTCREDIYPFDRDVRAQAGDLVTYRPPGLPHRSLRPGTEGRPFRPHHPPDRPVEPTGDR